MHTIQISYHSKSEWPWLDLSSSLKVKRNDIIERTKAINIRRGWGLANLNVICKGSRFLTCHSRYSPVLTNTKIKFRSMENVNFDKHKNWCRGVFMRKSHEYKKEKTIRPTCGRTTNKNPTHWPTGYTAKLKWHMKKKMICFCGRFTFVVFKIVLHFRVVLRLWKILSYVCGGA